MADKDGNKTGGRPKGSLGIKTKTLWEMVERTGQNPIDVIWAFCFNQYKSLGYDSATVVKAGRNGETYEEERIQPKDRLDAAKFLCNKMYPDLKSIEVSGKEDGNPIELNNNFTLKDLIQIAREAKKNDASKP